MLEHIDDDVAELNLAAKLLQTGGHVAVLAPAYNFYFQNSTLQLDTFVAIQNKNASNHPSKSEIVQLRYLDSVGTVLSLGTNYY